MESQRGITAHQVELSVRNLERRIQQSPELLSETAGKSSCCIFRVPQSLVDINEKAYQPHIVSIGPYHHGKSHLKMMEEHKSRYLRSLVDRTRGRGVFLETYFSALVPLEGKIRESYSETIHHQSRELIEMMVVDGCFVVELFCKVGQLVQHDEDDPLFNMEWVLSFLMRDLLRLENQIPFFVLETLLKLSLSTTQSNINGVPTLAKLTLEFFNYAVQRPKEVIEGYFNKKANHLLDLFRSTYIPCTKAKKPKSPHLLQLIPSAKKLQISGVKFKVRKTDSYLDIKFRGGVLDIPAIAIDDFSTSVFLNCIAYEQCYSPCSKHVTAYATLMGCLINTPADAGFLCDHKIIENYFGTDEEVVRFFNQLGKDVVFDIQNCYLSKLFEDINGYCRNDWHVRWAGFKHTYFETPWSFMSALAALILLILTMVQSFFAAYAYFHPPKN